MKNFSRNNFGYQAFTLVEMVVTITILSLIFTSVMSVFIYYSTLGAKVEANRLLQSNIKNITEHIDNDIRKNKIKFAEIDPVYGTCQDINDHCIGNNEMYSDVTDRLNTNDASYFLGIPGPLITDVDDTWETLGTSWTIISANDYASKCGLPEKNCALVKRTNTGRFVRLSNSWVSFSNLYFHVSNDAVAKVTMNFDMNIASGKGIKQSLVESSSIKVQTTMSEKLLDINE